MILYDAHCHLQDPRIAPHLDGVVGRAREAGVAGVHVNATCEEDMAAALALRDRFPGFVAVSLGIHPWKVGNLRGGWLGRLRAAVLREGAGLGEIGLDARMGDGLDERRRRVFLGQLDLSRELSVPASLHCRGAWGELLDILLKGPRHPAGLLVHAYSGPAGVLPALAAKNVAVSFGGSSARAGNKRAAAAMRAAVDGFWTLETDAPDLPPELPPGRRAHLRDATGRLLSEPAYLPLVLERVAAIRGVPPGRAAELAGDAFRRLFGSIPSAAGHRGGGGEKCGEASKEA